MRIVFTATDRWWQTMRPKFGLAEGPSEWLDDVAEIAGLDLDDDESWMARVEYCDEEHNVLHPIIEDTAGRELWVAGNGLGAGVKFIEVTFPIGDDYLDEE